MKKLIYTNLDKAILELKKRSADLILKDKINKHFQLENIPDIFLKNNVVLCSGLIATPNLVTSRFLSVSQGIGFNPVIFEELEFAFSPASYFCKILGTLTFYKVNKNITDIKHKNILNFRENLRKKMQSVKTFSGLDLKTFHNQLLLSKYPSFKESNLVNISSFNKNYNKNIERKKFEFDKYYDNLLSIFIQNNILVLDNNSYSENSENLKHLTSSFLRVKKKFGLEPLVVELVSQELVSPIWHSYEYETQDIFRTEEQRESSTKVIKKTEEECDAEIFRQKLTDLENVKNNKETANNYKYLIADILEYIFEDYIRIYKIESSTLSGHNSRDIIFEIINTSAAPFSFFVQHHNACTIITECKNTDKLMSSNHAQISNYLSEKRGLVGFIVSHRSNKNIVKHQKANFDDHKKVILHISNEDLIFWLDAKNKDRKSQIPIRALNKKYLDIKLS